MKYAAVFKQGQELEGYYILLNAKSIEIARDYMEENYKGEYDNVYPLRVYQRYQIEYSYLGLFREIKLKEVVIK